LPHDQRHASLSGVARVTNETPKNLAASVRQRLMNVAQADKEDFQYVLMRYGLERFLYRLSKSKDAGRFVLKGAMLFQLWSDAPHRPTRDLDLLATGAPSITDFEATFRQICEQPVEDDGLIFDAADIHGEAIKEEDEYQGIRMRGQARLGNVRIPLQIDIGFGDAVTPGPVQIEYPTLLNSSAPMLLAYNRETVIAEKFQAMVLLGIANSRMKDFFDLWLLASQFQFEGTTLADAIQATFERRMTELPSGIPLALSPEFSSDPNKQLQWRAFLRKAGLPGVELTTVVELLQRFLMPMIEALRHGNSVSVTWNPKGPWRN
jgi:hypothetical protein